MKEFYAIAFISLVTKDWTLYSNTLYSDIEIAKAQLFILSRTMSYAKNLMLVKFELPDVEGHDAGTGGVASLSD